MNGCIDKYKKYIDFAKVTLAECGKIARKWHGKECPDNNLFINEYVSNLINSQILKSLNETFPTHALFTKGSNEVGEAEYEWICDPLDGAFIYLKNTPEYDASVKDANNLVTKIHAEGIFDASLNNEQYINILGRFSKISELISHTYYEAISQVVMLSSQDLNTALLKSRGEFNAHCYYDIIKEYGDLRGRQFDVSSFSPDYRELCDLLLKLNKNSKLALDVESTISYLIINFRNLLAKIFISDDVAKTHLSGWLLMSRLKPKDQAYLIDHFNHQVDDYRDSKNILLLVNAATLKPELGIPVNAKTTFYIAKEDDVLKKISCFSCLHWYILLPSLIPRNKLIASII